MRAVESQGLSLCRFQGDVFSSSTRVMPECGSAVFVRRFMRSELARRIDAGEYGTVPMESSSAAREVAAEFGGRPYGSQLYSAEQLYWMGYVYRYWCIAYETTSKSAYAVAGAREMRELYYPYHTLDPLQAIERILEAKGIDPYQDMVTRGVDALRRIRSGEAGD